MHAIQSARFQPGASLDTIPPPPSSADSAVSTSVVRGRALIFWDLKVPGKRAKLDAIDTDQITPAADCVSESLETLDERWKIGAFRYLMPAAQVTGATRVVKELVIFPGSGGVGLQIERPDVRLRGESIAHVFRAVGGRIRQSWCGPCFGQGPDALVKGQRAIASFNRNWQNRMGLGGEGYLASPAVVAASALVGYMAPPSELGLTWNPEAFGV